MSARRRQARSVRPDRLPATATSIASTLFGCPVRIDDRPSEPTTRALIADRIRMGLIRTDLDEDDLLKLFGDPTDERKPVGVLKIYHPEAN